jgi:hypothetical protein
MRKANIWAAVVLFSTITSTQGFAQSFGEPAAYAAQHPDRDVLNGGALTPAARAAAGLESLKSLYGATDVAKPSARRSHKRFRRPG